MRQTVFLVLPIRHKTLPEQDPYLCEEYIRMVVLNKIRENYGYDSCRL